jgi:Icc-related predicted phosphoesterase
MSRLWIFSDLHQDWADNAWDPAAHAPDFDTAVVAGDVHMPLTKSLDWLADRLPGVPVIYVPGNHDFWSTRDDRYTLADQIGQGRDLAARRGIYLLMDDAVTLGGVRFIGGTLWTNLFWGTQSLGHALRSSRRGMNDYRRIRRRPSGKHKYVRPLDTIALNRATSMFLHAQLAIPCANPTVVVTHHAPHPLSLSDPDMDLRWCYVNNLGELIDRSQPDLWIHGHLHDRADYRICATRIVCNPRGHIEEDSARTFDPRFVIQTTTRIAQVQS